MRAGMTIACALLTLALTGTSSSAADDQLTIADWPKANSAKKQEVSQRRASQYLEVLGRTNERAATEAFGKQIADCMDVLAKDYLKTNSTEDLRRPIKELSLSCAVIVAHGAKSIAQ